MTAVKGEEAWRKEDEINSFLRGSLNECGGEFVDRAHKGEICGEKLVTGFAVEFFDLFYNGITILPRSADYIYCQALRA